MSWTSEVQAILENRRDGDGDQSILGLAKVLMITV